LPSGQEVRGRALRDPLPPGPAPDFSLYLLAKKSEPFPWEWRWLRWPDFRLPTDGRAASEAFVESWQRAAAERVGIACGGGRVRTGTALACIAVIDGVPADQAAAFVRRSYHEKAVETAWQRRYVAGFDEA
jgi:protein-tyrosine phosphatase